PWFDRAFAGASSSLKSQHWPEYFGSIARIMALRQATAGCGSKQKCRSPRGMSAFGGKADMAFCGANFRL
ncbi:MAG: hypothetical protein WA759_05480, partial [Pseudolabrys sp.]